LSLPRTASSTDASAMRPASARVVRTRPEGTPSPGPRSRIEARNDSTTTTWPASTRAATTWTTRRPTNSIRPAAQTRRVERRTSCHSRPTERRWLRLSIWRSSGSSSSPSSSLTGPPRARSPQQPLLPEVVDEGRRVRLSGLASDPVLGDERVGELLEGAVLGEQLGQPGTGDVRREVDGSGRVEDDELTVDLLPGDALAPQLHVHSLVVSSARGRTTAVTGPPLPTVV